MYKELDNKTEKELEEMLSQERAKLYGLRMKLAVNQLKDVREARECRKMVAKILTKLQTVKAEK